MDPISKATAPLDGRDSMGAGSERRLLDAKRAAARRTALVVAIIAAAVYAAFFLSGVLGAL